MISKLTEQDIKILKFEKRIGYVFLIITLLIGALLNLTYFLLIKREPNYLLVGLIDLGIVLLAYFVCNRINHKINQDLKENTKELLKRTVQEKKEEFCSEPGSGMLYIPVLGDLFPKLWGQKMNMIKRYFIVANNYKHEVNIDIYSTLEEGADIYIHFANHSGKVLSISKIE
ncbi:MAG: hypothetical protein QMB39_09355 [Bacteroidales bacterium]